MHDDFTRTNADFDIYGNKDWNCNKTQNMLERKNISLNITCSSAIVISFAIYSVVNSIIVVLQLHTASWTLISSYIIDYTKGV